MTILNKLLTFVTIGVLSIRTVSPLTLGSKPEEARCVMYGKNAASYSDYYAYSGPPLQLDSNYFDVLQAFCPELTEQYGDELCCDPLQVSDLVANLALPQSILKRCPTCYYNFRQTFCNLACSPVQSSFLIVNETSGQPPAQPVVRRLDFLLQESYVQGSFDACLNVQMDVEEKVLMNAMDLLCGPWGKERCTPRKWFDYMGSAANGFSPFEIIFKYANAENEFPGLEPFDFATVPCSGVPPGSSSPCSCTDCTEICPAAPMP